MTIDEMFNELEDKARDTFIVTLKYKYDFEENYTIENHILEYDSITDSYVWLNDWYEGQTDIEVLGYMLLGDVDTTKVEPCEDCISRQAVLNMQYRIDDSATLSTSDVVNVDDIEDLPPVTPQPKMGHWINQHVIYTNATIDFKVCSECRYEFSYDAETGVSDANYCPNCGAKMEGK